MAKKKLNVNRAEAIRQYDKAHPGISPTVVAAELKQNGFDVEAQYVSTVRSQAKKMGGASRKRGRPAGKKTASVPTTRKSSVAERMPIETLLQLKDICNRLGGYAQAREALDLLEAVSR